MAKKCGCKGKGKGKKNKQHLNLNTIESESYGPNQYFHEQKLNEKRAIKIKNSKHKSLCKLLLKEY